MTTTAMLAWFDEPATLLTQAVESLHGFADRLVAFDGAYELCPGAEVTSPPEQEQAIRDAAGPIEVWVGKPMQLWSGQVQKRHQLLQAAAQGSDFVLPFDADWVLDGDREVACAQLEHTPAESLTIRFETPPNPDRPLAETAANEWHAETIGTTRLPLVYRVMPGMRMVAHHWFYSGLRPDGERVAFWGEDGVAPVIEPLEGVTIRHLCHFRDQHTIERNRDFCKDRDRQVQLTGAEA